MDFCKVNTPSKPPDQNTQLPSIHKPHKLLSNLRTPPSSLLTILTSNPRESLYLFWNFI